MSRSTRLLQRKLALLILVAATAIAGAAAPSLPPTVTRDLPELTVQGGGELTFFGLSIYDAQLYRTADGRGWSSNEPFALQLVYHRHLYGSRIAERSVDEIAKLGYRTPEQRAGWGAMLKQIFPDVVAGDRLTGVNLPARGVQFFQNGRPIGAIEDREFAQAFFAIWLDPRTSEPALRKQLLGEP